MPISAKVTSRRCELTTGNYAYWRLPPVQFAVISTNRDARYSHPFSCSCVYLVDQVLPRRFPKSVRRLVLLVDQHIRIVAAQERLPHRRRAKPQIEVAILNRQPGAGRLVDRPQQARSDARGLQRAAVDDDDLDSRNRLAGVLPVARVYRGETLVVKPNAGNLPVPEQRDGGGGIEPRRADTLERLRRVPRPTERLVASNATRPG